LAKNSLLKAVYLCVNVALECFGADGKYLSNTDDTYPTAIFVESRMAALPLLVEKIYTFGTKGRNARVVRVAG
jgi:hypothetical protein